MARNYVRDKNGRFASKGASRSTSGSGSSSGGRKAGPVQQEIKKLEIRISRQQQFLRRASTGRYSAREMAIEKDELKRMRSQLAGLKSRKH